MVSMYMSDNTVRFIELQCESLASLMPEYPDSRQGQVQTPSCVHTFTVTTFPVTCTPKFKVMYLFDSIMTLDLVSHLLCPLLL